MHKICIEAACSNYASGPGGRCDEHRRLVERERSRRRREKTKNVYGKRMWRMRRKQAIERQPLCPGDGINPCPYNAIVQEVDHVIPLSEAPDLAYTSSNHVARCSRCHWRKNSAGELTVTDVQIMYADLREAGYGHHKAIRELARTLGVDPATVRTVLEKAEALNGRSYQDSEAK